MKILSLILLILILSISTSYANMYVIYDKVNEKYIDFQSKSTKETLINNAIRNGRDASDFEVKEVTDEEYWRLENETYKSIREKARLEVM